VGLLLLRRHGNDILMSVLLAQVLHQELHAVEGRVVPEQVLGLRRRRTGVLALLFKSGPAVRGKLTGASELFTSR